MLAVFGILFILVHATVVVPHEEAFLADRFGSEYLDYRARTRRWIPTLPARAVRRSHGFDWRAAWRGERHSLWLNGLGTLFIALRAVARQ